MHALLLDSLGNGLVDVEEQRETVQRDLDAPFDQAARVEHLRATWGLGVDARRQEARMDELTIPTFGED